MRSPRDAAGPHHAAPTGEPIRSDELLPWSALHTRLGWGARRIETAKTRPVRSGFETRCLGGT